MNNKSGTSVLLWIVTMSLIIYTATRSYDLISQTMPEGQQIAGFFALAALDGGLLAWLFWTTRSSAPGAQRTIGTLMIVVDIAGIAAAVLGDTLMNFEPSTKAGIGTMAVWIVGFIIVANIAGTIAAEVTNPDQQMRDAARAVTHELNRQKAEHLTTNAPEIAARVASVEAQHWANQMVAAFQHTRPGANGKTPMTTYQKDASNAPENVPESEFERAQAIIEAAGGKVTRPRSKS